MSIAEFSNEFDVLLNSYNDQKAFGDTDSFISIQLDEYEKSVLLTKAQDMLVKQYFNEQRENVDATSKKQIDFSTLIKVDTLSSIPGSGFDSRGLLYERPKALLILNESIEVQIGTPPRTEFHTIVPISTAEYDRLMSKPYKQPFKSQAWRLQDADNFEIILRSNASVSGAYKVRILARPEPIVLIDLTGTGLKVDGVEDAQSCKLDPIMHQDILALAVDLAFNRRNLTTPAPPRANNNNN